MSLTDRLFGRAGGVKLDIATIQAHFAKAVPRVAEPVPELLRARFADRCRDVGLTPVLPEEFDAAVAEIDLETWRRLALFISVLDVDAVQEALPKLAAARPVPELLAAAFTGLARAANLLTIEVLGQSPLRLEELARLFVAKLGAAIAGESAAESQKKLERLDYGRLLAEAEKARASAAERADRLRKLQDEQEQRRTRRGKW